ncbi:nucleotidyltransferase domain-containing protein [Glycomyces luteolus]|uniref:Nucleotidyltransferase domain-containing protein n=1 Tax=Glycomyces luteolus TaxID=2670330 RepID=A0A9X3PB72_9ACTN|nr:nucleotidyltransferase domain-containing protein [Glycomyces luteolus]MDA1360135.1 nucleotidyltransferase domain-containing protein [Glycomyces luteolus]
MPHHLEAARIAAIVAAELAPASIGIALFGSVANGTDHPHSDIDLILAADGASGVQVKQVEGRMVTLTRKTPDDLAAAFTRPWEAVTAVAAWRAARILTDPQGTMHRLRTEAQAWTWDALAAEGDRWAAAALVGLAEEVHKVCGMLARGRARAAAANRAVLALQLGQPMAAAHRILVDSENDLWDALADAAGPAWARAWDDAAGVSGCDHERGCAAALELYRLATARLDTHLDGDDRAIVRTARDLAAATCTDKDH